MYLIIRSIRSSGRPEGALEEVGRAEQRITTETAPNELKLGEGAQSESGSSARWWRRGCSSGVICENHLVGSELLSESGHTRIHTQPPVEYPSGKPLEAKLLKKLRFESREIKHWNQIR